MIRKIVVLLFFCLLMVDVVFAQMILQNPQPLRVRSTVTGEDYTGLLIAYSNTGSSAAETDYGLAPFDPGANTGMGELGPFSFTDTNLPGGTDIVELVSSNYEVFTQNGWLPGTGYTIALRLSGSAPKLGNENGLPASSNPTVYQPYLSRFVSTVPPNRLFGEAQIATLSSVYNPLAFTPLGNTLYSDLKEFDFEGDILAFSSTYPLAYNMLFTVNAGNCNFPNPSLPYYNYQFSPPFGSASTVSECISLSRKIMYIDFSSLSTSSEGTLLPSSGTTFSSWGSLYEGYPSITRNQFGQYIIFRETSGLSPQPNQPLDVSGYNIVLGIEEYIIPEPPSGFQNQYRPSASYPLVAFVESPNQMFSGSLYLFNIMTLSRLPNPIAANVYTAYHGPKLSFDSLSQRGILAWHSNSQNPSLNFVIIDANGRMTVPASVSLPLGAFAFKPGMLAVTSMNGQMKIYYVVSIWGLAGYAGVSEQIWVFDANNGVSTQVYAPANRRFDEFEGMKVSNDNKLLSVDSRDISGFPRNSLILNLESKAVYEPGKFYRTLGSAQSTMDIPLVFVSDMPTDYAAIIGDGIGRLKVSNLR